MHPFSKLFKVNWIAIAAATIVAFLSASSGTA